MSDRHERNKRNAMAFYDLMFNQCRPAEAIEKYVGVGDIQHNPDVADGKRAFIEYFEAMTTQYPGKKVEFKRAITEGIFVAVSPHDEQAPDRKPRASEMVCTFSHRDLGSDDRRGSGLAKRELDRASCDRLEARRVNGSRARSFVP